MFKPAGIPTRELAEVVMTLDQFEAVRLADLDGLYQEQAAEKMGVSRSTFSRIVEAAHRKIAEALVHGKALKIEGGPVFDAQRRRCERCAAEWRGPADCPKCREAAACDGAQESGASSRMSNHPPNRCGRRRQQGRRST